MLLGYDFNSVLKSGLYGGKKSVGYPLETDFNFLFVIRHGDSNNNCQFQLSSSYGNDDRLFFRKFSTPNMQLVNPTWHEFATRGINKFTGNQRVIGTGGYLIGNEEDAGNRFTVRLYDQAYMAYYPEMMIRTGVNNNLLRCVMKFKSDGNVGIGIENPQNKLDVNGTIRAKEIKVESDGWPDYVFDLSYNLPSLKEVEAHIQEHKHLPGIPSETEVKENGVNLGDMQVKMLQKIEELMLYTIQQQEMIDKLNIKIEKLENRK